MAKKIKKPIPKSKRPSDKNLFDIAGYMNTNPYARTLAPNYGTNPMGLTSMGPTNTITNAPSGAMATEGSAAGTGVGAALSAASSTANMVMGGINIAKLNDTSLAEAQIDALSDTIYNGNSYADLANQRANTIEVGNVSMQDLEGSAKNNWKQAGSIVGTGATAGASIGSMVLPGVGTAIGAGIGALAGGITAGIGRLAKRSKAKKKKNQLDDANERAQRQANIEFNNAHNTMLLNQAREDAASYYAYGGLFNRFDDGGPIGTTLPVEQSGIDWMNYWYSQRGDVWKQNYIDHIPDYDSTNLTEEQVSNLASRSLNNSIKKAETTPSIIVNRKSGKIKQKDSSWNSEEDSEVLSWDKANEKYASEKFSNPNLNGYYNTEDNYIIYPEDVDESTALHEQIHAGEFSPAIAAIANRKWTSKYTKGLSEEEKKYIFNPEEIYPRLNQLRKELNINPNKEYSLSEISDIVHKYSDYSDLNNRPANYENVRKTNILNRFGLEDLEFLFNKVAHNNPSNLNIEVPEQMKYINPSEEVNFAAEGGPLFNEFSNGVTIINEGGTHEKNPYEGIQVGVDPEGIPNLVEEGEVIFNDYVFSDRLKVPNAVRNKYKLRGNKETTFADSAKEVTKMSEEMPNDPIVKRTMEVRLNQLMQEQEVIRMKKGKNRNNEFSLGGQYNAYKKYAGKDAVGRKGYKKTDSYADFKKSQDYTDFINSRNEDWSKLGTSIMQATPVIGSLAAVINDLTGGNEADYSNVRSYERAIKEAYNPIKAKTLNNYLEYNPYDTSFELNKLVSTQAANRRALVNSSAGNASAARAALLASDNTYNNQIGDTYKRAREYNDTNRKEVAAFNRATDQYNKEALNQAAQFNAQLAANKADAIYKLGQYKDAVTQANRAEKSANLTGLLEGISGLGETFYNQGRVKYLQDNGILVGKDGKLYSKKELTNKGACGGKIKRRRRLS